MKGQASLEQLIITSLGIGLVAIMFYFLINQATDNIRTTQARDAIAKIARTSDYIYSLGPGSKDQVEVLFPEGTQFVNVTGNTIWLRVSLSSGDADVFANTRAPLIGVVTEDQGKQQITLVATDNGKVRFGASALSCTPSSITKTIAQGASASDSITISNSGDTTLTNVTASLSGSIASLTSISSPPSASINASSSTSAGLNFSIPLAQTPGTYTGTLTVSASNGTECSSSIIVSVSSGVSPDTTGPLVTSLSSYPAAPNSSSVVTINATGDDSTTGNSLIASCSVSLDGGSYNTMTVVDGTYDEVVEDTTYSLGALSAGTHNVSVRCADSSTNTGAVSSISITVTDGTGPVITALSYYPASPTTLSNISINATGDDSTTGNNAIAMCQISVDSGAYSNMTAVDGTYNSVSESVTKSIGNFTAGIHTASVRCIDSLGNLGTANTTSFTVIGVDTTGPITTSISYAPLSPTTLSNISINATGDDTTTGASNISMCQISVDSGAYTNMTAVGTLFGTSIVQNVTYSVGSLSAGLHNASVRCIDSAGNTGSANTTSFTVTSVDTTGPIVFSASHTPSPAYASNSITINALASDNQTGNNTIANCSISLDGGAYAAMSASDGLFNSITENATYSAGILSVGSHTASLRCTDSLNNLGNVTNYTFSVLPPVTPREILFLTTGASPTTNEQYWITWISTFNSSIGFNWTMSTMNLLNVTNGTANVSNYRIVVMADYPTGNSPLNTLLNSYRSSSHYVVLLGQGMQRGIPEMGDGTGSATSNSRADLKVQASHYTTTGFTVGTVYTILNASSSIYYHSSFTATNVASMGNNDGRIVIGQASRLITYGPTRPDTFNANGTIIARRVIDFALNNSVAGG